MSERDEYNIPSAEQELHSPREEFAPLRDEYPPPGSGGATAPERRRKRSRIWIYAAVFMLTASLSIQDGVASTAPEEFPDDDPQIIQDIEPAPVRDMTDAEILLAQGTWNTGSGLTVHFDPGGGWWSADKIVGIMQWSEDAQGHVSYSGYASYRDIFDNESGPYIDARQDSCSGTVYVDRSSQTYSINMGNPFSMPQTSYYGSVENKNNAALAALYDVSMEDLLENSRWQLSELDGNEDRLARAIEDENPFNRQIIWISALTFDGEIATLCYSDIYGGSKEFQCSYKQLSQFEILLTPITDREYEDWETPLIYPIDAPEGGAYSRVLWGYPTIIKCKLSFSENGALLLADNSFWSWLYENKVCTLELVK